MSKYVVSPTSRLLAILGGKPLFEHKAHVGQPNPGQRADFMRRVEGVLDSRWFTNNGGCVRELEARVADFVGVRHCVLVCNATIGLQVAIRALDLQGEVIVPSMTFIATAHALAWQGIKPVFCDIDPRTHLIDPLRLDSLVTPRTSAVLGVHLWGNACDVEAIDAVARRHGLAVLYDAAHAFGCSAGKHMVGGFGACEVFSFHATKFFNTFEGGAITTNDDALALRLRRMINFGFAGVDQVADVGLNGKMSEVCAAMGLASLPVIETTMRANERNLEAYRCALSAIPGLRIVPTSTSRPHNFQYVVLEYIAPEGAISRDRLIDVLWAENVMARRYFHPGCHRAQPYRTLCPPLGAGLSHTEAATDRVLVLPTGPAVDAGQCEQIAALIRSAIEAGPELALQLDALRDRTMTAA